ncbi:uncharacterized protein ATNIH1004_005390 [Aspergillus tanneri]|uniref:Uncharacterized protein n=1 Tax=Aspergillus tanneri TaxID=1220188 RepID=A0A5M9MIA0_9EURO|nr:uncharacterized protein ATNIH1004_005390 [Aspergillus tanneri]KAA8646715.1 hypothetical protein ATNIH1004_005390 [Aspergillus tanneri]
MSLNDLNNINNSIVWSNRESIVAIIVVNIPCIKPIFNASTWRQQSSSRDIESSHGIHVNTTFEMTEIEHVRDFEGIDPTDMQYSPSKPFPRNQSPFEALQFPRPTWKSHIGKQHWLL